MIKLQVWNVINVDNEIIKSIYTSKGAPSIIAFNKLKFLFPKTYFFLKLKKGNRVIGQITRK